MQNCAILTIISYKSHQKYLFSRISLSLNQNDDYCVLLNYLNYTVPM